MTALKPVDTRDVVAVASERYPVNTKCAHPECSEPATVHHAFPRSQTKSDSYFVSIEGGEPIPHAVGLCGSGTTGHHGDVEEHRAWIRYEDGVWNWYERERTWSEETCTEHDGWKLLGPLNPQPGSVEAKPKRRKFTGEAKRKRANWQVKVPADHEDGAGILDDGFERAYGVVAKKEDLQPMEDRTQYVCLADIFEWVGQQE